MSHIDTYWDPLSGFWASNTPKKNAILNLAQFVSLRLVGAQWAILFCFDVR